MRKGFTLVELMVVLVIIGIIVAFVVPSTLRAIRIAQSKDCANNIRTLETAVQMYFADNRVWPNGIKELIGTPAYLPDSNGNGTSDPGDIPVCPITGQQYNLIVNPATGNRDTINRQGHFSDAQHPDKHD